MKALQIIYYYPDVVQMFWTNQTNTINHVEAINNKIIRKNKDYKLEKAQMWFTPAAAPCLVLMFSTNLHH
jgi:hypothetical protein